jgi:hypothetical protein
MSTCVEQPDGTFCPPKSNWATCSPWDISTQDRLNCYIDGLINESLNIAGAKINVRKLLGVQEQTALIDLAKNGNAISGGDWTGFPASNAFTMFTTEWRSKQGGSTAIIASSYLGYDFGEIKIDSGRRRYGIDTSIRHQITTIRIKQSNNPNYRATKVRVERSEDGVGWYGVAAVDLPNDSNLNTISFKHSVPNRFWRLRPLAFAGGSSDSWGVQALEMHSYMASAVDNIQDKIWMENRNRDYDRTWTEMKGYYTLTTPELDITKFMAELGDSGTYRIKLPFSACVTLLGRPIIIGDIFELPSEAQYTPTLEVRKKFLEVTDVTWDPDSYTPGWMPTLLLITAKPAIAMEETQQIFGDLAAKTDDSGLFDNDDGNNPNYQDYSTVEQTINQQALDVLPQRGSEGSNVVREFTKAEIAQTVDDGVPHITKIGFNRTGLYVEDAMPQNGDDFTEGTTFPPSPSDGDYHRLTYTGLAKDVPPRLYRWSITKGRWVYLETDRRLQFNNQKAVIEEYLTSSTRKPAGEIN